MTKHVTQTIDFRYDFIKIILLLSLVLYYVILHGYMTPVLIFRELSIKLLDTETRDNFFTILQDYIDNIEK